jgi:hypothetical protein
MLETAAMIAIRLFLLASLLALAAALAAPAQAAMPLRAQLPGMGQESAVRATPAPVTPAEVAQLAR